VAEGHLNWEGKNEVWGLCPQWGPFVGPGALPPEADDFFCKNMLLCHGFKNDIAIFPFIAYFNMKWKKNQFGGSKVGTKSRWVTARPAQQDPPTMPLG